MTAINPRRLANCFGICTCAVHDNIWTTETINIPSIENHGWAQGYCQSVATGLYIFGGFFMVSYTSNIFKYTPATKWTALGSLPPTATSVSVYHEPSGLIFLVGGMDQETEQYSDKIYVFDIRTENITDIWTMTEKKAALSADIIHNNLYIVGGLTDTGPSTTDPLSTIEMCTLPSMIFATTTEEETTTFAMTTTTELQSTFAMTTTTELQSTFVMTTEEEITTTTELQSTFAMTTTGASESNTTAISPTYQSSILSTNENVLLIVLILVGVLLSTAVVVAGLRFYCKRKKKGIQESEEVKAISIPYPNGNDNNAINIRAMKNNLNHIPLNALVTCDQSEGREVEMPYTNEGQRDGRNAEHKIKRASGTRTTRGQTKIPKGRNQTTKGDTVDDI